MDAEPTTTDHIRVVALAIVRRPHTGQLLVFEGHDPARDLTYHRPLGGGVLFGEPADAAVRRELMEELGVGVRTHRGLGVTESIFTVAGRRYHEVFLLVDSTFEDPSLYRQEHFPDIETGREPGLWRSPDSAIPLFPERLPDVIDHT
jgi:8-oxo-dGTP pyrophosphatase MutT (NUDIX family)